MNGAPQYTLIDDLMDLEDLENPQAQIPGGGNILPPAEAEKYQKYVRPAHHSKYEEYQGKFKPDYTPQNIEGWYKVPGSLGQSIQGHGNSGRGGYGYGRPAGYNPGHGADHGMPGQDHMGSLGVPGADFGGNPFTKNQFEGFRPPMPNSPYSCLDVHSHIDNCPICSKFYKNNYVIYIVIIVLLVVICLILLKKVLDR